MWTFEANAKCNNVNHVWSHFDKFLIVLKYHRRPWVNIFDTDISRCINTYSKVVYLAFFGIFMLLDMSLSKILAQGRLWYFKTIKNLSKWLQTWFTLYWLQPGFKCWRKIHLNTQCRDYVRILIPRGLLVMDCLFLLLLSSNSKEAKAPSAPTP